MKQQAMAWFLSLSLGLSLGLGAGLARADDTDIYLNPRTDEVDAPLVMFSLDYRPNLGSAVQDYTEFFAARLPLGKEDPDLPQNRGWTFFDVIRLSLKVVLLEVSGVRVGLMLNHDNRNNCEGPENNRKGCSNGGYIARGFRRIEPDDSNGAVAEFAEVLRTVPIPQGNQSHAYQGAELFFELFRYLSGGGVYNGHNGYTDYASNTNVNLDKEDPRVGPAWDARIETADGLRYNSPILDASNCAKIFTVNLMFQVANQDADSNAAISQSLANGGMGFDPGNNNTFTNVIARLNQTDLANGTTGTAPEVDGFQNVTSYFVVDPRFINNTTRSYAQAGGTNEPLAFAEDPAVLINTLRGILQDILSVSTTFVSASVPVNVFNRAEIVDNVYIALFQAEETPRWSGNVKKLILKESVLADGSQQSLLVDALGQGAVAGDGRIRFDALTFWTDPNGQDLALEDLDQSLFAKRDGRHTVRGGTGQRIPGFLTGDPGATNAENRRKLFFNDGTTLAALDATDAVADKLIPKFGVSTRDESLALIRYARGYVGDTATSTTVREWWMGDPMHSRPLPLNYGSRGSYTDKNQAIYVAYGSNDGYFRMTRNTVPGDSVVQDGAEVWAFMPEEAMAIQRRLRDNNAAPDLDLHPYGVDGAPASLFLDVNATTGVPGKAYVYFGMRRGSAAYYALDVTDPEAPKLAWKINASTSGFSRLGLSFSRPQVARVRLDGVEVPVVAFSGGYDRNKDYYTEPQPKSVGTDDDTGTAIYVVHAETGALLWEGTDPKLVDSIPSDITVVDTNGDSFADRIVFGDSGGNVWRVDLPESQTTDWSMHQIARLGRHFVSDRANDRRFFHSPDVVQTKDADGKPYDAVVIGSGDREDPLDRGGPLPENWLYVVRDYNVGVLNKDQKAALVTDGALTFTDHDELADITECVPVSACTALNFAQGWRLKLNLAPGEKNLSSPFTFLGTIFFTTYIPPGTIEKLTCGPSEGSGALYAVNLVDGSPKFNFDLTDDSATVEDGPTTEGDRARLLSSGGIPSEVVYIGGGNLLLGDLSVINAGAEPRLPTFWRRDERGERVPVDGSVE